MTLQTINRLDWQAARMAIRTLLAALFIVVLGACSTQAARDAELAEQEAARVAAQQEAARVAEQRQREQALQEERQRQAEAAERARLQAQREAEQARQEAAALARSRATGAGTAGGHCCRGGGASPAITAHC